MMKLENEGMLYLKLRWQLGWVRCTLDQNFVNLNQTIY